MASLDDLGQQVARLAQSINRLVAVAERQQRETARAKRRALRIKQKDKIEFVGARDEVPPGTLQIEMCPLVPLDEETLAKKQDAWSYRKLMLPAYMKGLADFCPLH